VDIAFSIRTLRYAPTHPPAPAVESGRADVLPLRADLAALLADAKGDADDGDRVIKVLPRIPTHRKYLAAADIPWLDDAGRRRHNSSIRRGQSGFWAHQKAHQSIGC